MFAGNCTVGGKYSNSRETDLEAIAIILIKNAMASLEGGGHGGIECVDLGGSGGRTGLGC